MKSNNDSKSINIQLNFKSSSHEINVYLNNTSPKKITFIIEFKVDFVKNIDID